MHHLVKADDILALKSDGSVLAHGTLQQLLDTHPPLLQEAGITTHSGADEKAQSDTGEAASEADSVEPPSPAASVEQDTAQNAAETAEAKAEPAAKAAAEPSAVRGGARNPARPSFRLRCACSVPVLHA